jgi:outer membrane receptor protein involved in Fe transport
VTATRPLRTATCLTAAAPLALALLTAPRPAHAQPPAPAQLQSEQPPPEGPPEERAGHLRAMSLEELLNLTTATGSGGEVEERATAAANIVFISRAEILQNGWQSVGEALATVPGLYLIDAGTGPSIGVRGVTGGLRAGTRLVKVMINGVAVNFRPDLRAFLGPEYLPIAAVERIEVAMGPLSSLYGANAFIATVNVITRTSPPGTQVEAAVGGQYMDGGGLGWRSSGLASYGGPNVSVLLAASTAGIDRSGRRIQKTFDAQHDPDPAAPDDPTRVDPRFQPLFMQGSQGDNSYPVGAFGQMKIWKTPLGGVTLEGGVQRLDANGEFELNSTLTHDSRESLVNGWLAGKLDKKWNELFSTNLTAGVSGGKPTRDERFFLTNSRTRTFERNFGYRALNGSFTSLLSFDKVFSIRLGLDGELDEEDVLYYSAVFNQAEGPRRPGERVELIDPDKPRRQLLSDLGADLQVSGTPVENLRITASGRMDRVSYGDFGPPLQYSWRLAVAQRFAKGLYAKLIAGRAFQAPSGVLMFAEPGFGAANNIIGNLNATGIPGLRPQTVESAELVVYGLIAQRAVLEGSVFYQVLKDKIEFRSGGTDYVARNGGQTEYAGAEGAAHFDFGPVKPFLTAAGVVRLIDQQILLTAPPAYPTFVATGGVDVDLFAQRLHLNGRVRVVGRRGATESNVLYNFDRRYSLPPYATVDATASTGGLRLIGDNAETRLIVSASDLLDQSRSEPAFGGYDVPSLGRRVLMELRQSF